MECTQNLERICFKYYAVTAKCGHVGKNVYIPITFAIKAESKKLAAKLARNMPRVKHDHKDAIIDVKEVNVDEWYEISNNNHKNLYLQCNNIQEQRSMVDELDLNILYDGYNDKILKTNKKDSLDYRRKKQDIISKEYRKEHKEYIKQYIY